MNRRAVYPGSFDPVTYGHIDLIKRGLKLFDQVIVAVAQNPDKPPLFTLEERMAMLRRATRGMRGVRIDAFHTLMVDYARAQGIRTVLRGLRMLSDFEFEFQMALTNRKLAPEIETVFLMPSEQYAHLSSRLIKEAASLGGDVRRFVPPFVAAALRQRLP